MSALKTRLGWATAITFIVACVIYFCVIYILSVDPSAPQVSDVGDAGAIPSPRPLSSDRPANTTAKIDPPSKPEPPTLKGSADPVTAAGDGPSPSNAAASGNPPAPMDVPAIRKILLPPVRLTTFQQETATATYVGMDACAKCHEGIHNSCLKTTHGRAFRDVDPAVEPPDGEFFDERSGKRFRAYRKGNEFRHRETIVGADGQEIELADYPMRYVVGSGHLTSTYLVERYGFLTESPITWYTSRSAWDYSPGYEKENAGFARPIYMECLQCHTGQTVSADNSRSRLKIQAMKIDCERCHGPGSKHVEARNASDNADIAAVSVATADKTITNPKWLTREQNEDACALCHLQGESEAYLLGRSTENFVPGHSLSDFRIDYTAKQADNTMKIVGHIEQLHQSKCYQSSSTMTCVTCHDPHRDPSSFDPVEFYRAKCLSCHKEESCRVPKPERLLKSERDSCSVCHMPSSPTDIPHVAAHQHRIGIHTLDKDMRVAPAASPEAAITLVPIQDVSHLPVEEQQRCLAMAYLALSKKTANGQLSQQYLERANAILAQLVQSGIQDPESLAGLAQTYLRREPASVIRLVKHAFDSGQPIDPDTEVKLQFALSDSYLALRQIPNAVEPLKRLTQLRLQAGDWYLLAVCQYNAGNIPEALATARKAVEIRPEVPNYHVLMAELLTHQGMTEEANQQRELAKLLGGRERKTPTQ